MLKRISILASIVVVAGCSTIAQEIPMPVFPQTKYEKLQANLQFGYDGDANDYAVQGGVIRPNSSVVINVPGNIFTKNSSNERVSNSSSNLDFQTEDFFNQAEQQIERELIGAGFRVLSRAKFEAKLRELRDEGRCDFGDPGCYGHRDDPGVKSVLDHLETQLANGAITQGQFHEQFQAAKDNLKTRSAGKNRAEGHKELTDISEVIRAAQGGDVNADYILQINRFDTGSPEKISKDLRENEQIRTFLHHHPEVLNMLKSNRKVTLACNVMGSRLNAKLVEVKTGQIVWIGEHSLNEFTSGVENIDVELGVEEFVANKKMIMKFVDDNNKPEARKNRSKDISIPEMRTEQRLIGPTVTSGNCKESAPSITSEKSARLAREVAKQLIKTIRISSAP